MSGNHIKLRFDNEDYLDQRDCALVYRIFYWAAYMGQNQIVEKIIRMGYSPFVRSFEKKNALMAAIISGNIETVKIILGFHYVPSKKKDFEKSKCAKDARGNNAKHLAYKLMQKEIDQILTDNNIGSMERNYRGLLPPEMNHKKLNELID